MKGIIFCRAYVVIILWIYSIPVNAQKETSYILFGMPQRTFMYGKSDRDNAAIIAENYLPDEPRLIIKVPSYNFAAGFFVVKSYTNKIAMRYGVTFAPHEQYYETYMKLEDRHIESSIRLKYLKFPVCLQYNYLVGRKCKLFVAGGPQLNMLISENGTLPFFGVNKYFPVIDMIDPGDAYKNFVLGAMAITGVELKLDDRVAVVLSPYGDFTFTAVQKETFVYMAYYYMNQPFIDPNVTLRTKSNITLGINVGLSFLIPTIKKSDNDSLK